MTKAVLLLLHRGVSYTQEMHDTLQRKGIALVGLTSQPASAAAFEDTKRYLADWIVTPGTQIERADVADLPHAFAQRGFELVACIATYEGYRLFMSEINAALGTRDCTVESLRLALNKFELRQDLAARGLSAVECYRIQEGQIPALDPAKTWFVKPIRGIASFGCFVLRSRSDFDDLASLRDQMKTDPAMTAMFMNEYDFLVEEFMEGPEFSFEIIVVGDDVYHIAVHDKAKMEHRARTVLESISISPPISLDRPTLDAGGEFVTRCLRELGLRAGAFHVEAKYWTERGRWEIIEINPRMGGSLVSPSVKLLAGASILELWLETLVVPDAELGALRARLAGLRESERLANGTSKATLFTVEFGEKGRTVAAIEFTPDVRQPEIVKMRTSAGTTLEAFDREVQIMDCLWLVDYATREQAYAEIIDIIARCFHISYEPIAEPVG